MTSRSVYFLRPVGMSGPIKIGCSDNLQQRIKPLAQWSPFPLEIAAAAPGGFKEELHIHRCFANSHSHHEWFSATPRLLALVDIVKATGSLEAAMRLEPEGLAPSMASRTPWPECRRMYMSYIMRVGNFERRTKIAAPNEIWKILKDWYLRPGFSMPEPVHIAALDGFLSSIKRAAA